MIRDVIILAFVGALVLLLGVSAIAGSELLFAANAFLYCVAFLAMGLGVYASTRFWAISPRRAYVVASACCRRIYYRATRLAGR